MQLCIMHVCLCVYMHVGSVFICVCVCVCVGGRRAGIQASGKVTFTPNKQLKL